MNSTDADNDVNDDEPKVIDETEEERAPSPKIYNISSWGADYTVELIVSRMKRNIFEVPPYQRAYVWNRKKASRFIESLLFGLPVPGVFLYEERQGKYIIVDGQQRLKSLQYFYDGFIGKDKFSLQDVAQPWNGKAYTELDDIDRQSLDDAIIHATIFRQDEPIGENTSIIHVFERINTGSMNLNAQEIRTCVAYGSFTKLLEELNQNASWRRIYGITSKRMKDRELILRFLAILHDEHEYKRPMSTFLDKFLIRHRDLDVAKAEQFRQEFVLTVEKAVQAFGVRAFRPTNALNTAVFDATMVALHSALDADAAELGRRYQILMEDGEFQRGYTRATADPGSLQLRLRRARELLLDKQ